MLTSKATAHAVPTVASKPYFEQERYDVVPVFEELAWSSSEMMAVATTKETGFQNRLSASSIHPVPCNHTNGKTRLNRSAGKAAILS